MAFLAEYEIYERFLTVPSNKSRVKQKLENELFLYNIALLSGTLYHKTLEMQFFTLRNTQNISLPGAVWIRYAIVPLHFVIDFFLKIITVLFIPEFGMLPFPPASL